jgi:hypothetical protein
LKIERIGYEQAAMRSSLLFSAWACASARSRGVNMTPAAVNPAPALFKKSRLSSDMGPLQIADFRLLIAD